MKYIFLGTADFSVAILEKMMSDFFYPELVISQPDKPVGREKIIQKTPIKEICEHHNLRCLQPEKISDALEEIKKIQPDLIVTAAYGQIIPDEILNTAKFGAINVHTSLLPKYRGSSPIQTAIANGENETGITIMLMDEKMDHGPILYQKKVDIEDDETGLSLFNKLAHVGADTLPKIIPDFLKGKIRSKPQNHEEATFTKIIKKNDVKINWNKTAIENDRFVRAYYDWPIAWTVLPDGKRLKIYKAEHVKEMHEPGKILIDKNKTLIGCDKGSLSLIEVQVEGSKVISAEQFFTGYSKFNDHSCK